MTPPTDLRRPRALVRPVVGAATLAALAAASWWGWLGWGPGPLVTDLPDAVTSTVATTTGPGDAWRYLGCAVTILVVAVEGHRRLDPRLAGPAVAAGFTAGYGAEVLRADGTGLAALSVLLVWTGMTKASTALRDLCGSTALREACGHRRGPTSAIPGRGRARP